MNFLSLNKIMKFKNKTQMKTFNHKDVFQSKATCKAFKEKKNTINYIVTETK